MDFRIIKMSDVSKCNCVMLFLAKEDSLSKYKTVEALVKKDKTILDYKKLTTFYTTKKGEAQKIILVGLGKKSEINPEKVQKIAGEAIRLINPKTDKTIAVVAPFMGCVRGVKTLTTGLILGDYKFTECKGKPEKNTRITVEIVTSVENASKAIKEANIISKNVMWVRDLINRPSNLVQPQTMAEAAEKIALDNDLAVEVLGEDEMHDLGMNSLLAVGQGSNCESKLITLEYKGGTEDAPTVAFVGKGITFDSGGISIKPSDGMGEMKDDMSGAAIVLGAIKTLAELKAPCNVIAVAACAENMPSGSAQRPGDIVKAANGKTIEVVNTDAEGRMVLADAVWYACEKGANKVIDIATLTGAVIIALGNDRAGIVSNDDALVKNIIEAGELCAEHYWQLPSEEEAKEALKSDVADLLNSAGRAAGTITGGLFIGEFVKPGIPWAHIDIGGTATASKAKGFIPKGGTGMGMATLVEFARRV